MGITGISPARRVCSQGLHHVVILLASILLASILPASILPAGSSSLCVAGARDPIALNIGDDDHILSIQRCRSISAIKAPPPAFAVTAPCSGTGRTFGP